MGMSAIAGKWYVFCLLVAREARRLGAYSIVVGYLAKRYTIARRLRQRALRHVAPAPRIS
jgi:Na+(H+)/acetate symporter ActP